MVTAAGWLYAPALYDPEYDSNDSDHKQNVNDAACAVANVSDGPGNEQNDCDDVEKISHKLFDLYFSERQCRW
jgi:hypothetical protein